MKRSKIALSIIRRIVDQNQPKETLMLELADNDIKTDIIIIFPKFQRVNKDMKNISQKNKNKSDF